MAVSSGPAQRIDWVDIAKGLCIILVVMMHSTLGVENAAGEQGWMHYLVAFAKPFRMPDFFLISGLFLSRVIDRPWRLYLDRKVVHFLYFYVLWLSIQFAFKAPAIAVESGFMAVFNAYLMAFIEPLGTLWFIYILPVFFVVTRLLKHVPKGITFLVLAVLEILPIHSGWIMVDEFCSRFVYFYLGYACAPYIFRLAEAVNRHRLIAVAGLAVWAYAEYVLVFTPLPSDIDSIISPGGDLFLGRGALSDLPIISLLLGLAGAIAIVALSSLLSQLPNKSWLRRALTWVGAHSLVVYLAFFLPMAVARTLLLRIGILDVGTISLLTTVSGVVGPLLFYAIIQWTGHGFFLFQRPQWAIFDGLHKTNRLFVANR